MFIKNKKTGLVQECNNEDVIRMCRRDSEHYEVTNERQQEKKKESLKTPLKDLEEMSAAEIKAVAKEKGIDGASSLTKEELLAILKEGA